MASEAPEIQRFARATQNGIDVNRDHLLLRTPEAQAIARVIATHRPQVVLDLHEFTVAGRWVDKFGAMQKLDAQVQPATVGNLHTGGVITLVEARWTLLGLLGAAWLAKTVVAWTTGGTAYGLRVCLGLGAAVAAVLGVLLIT